jgi:hypothetical protein
MQTTRLQVVNPVAAGSSSQASMMKSGLVAKIFGIEWVAQMRSSGLGKITIFVILSQ